MFRGTTWSSMHGRVGQTHWWWHETRWWYYWWYWWRAGVEAEKDQYWGAVNLVTLVFYKTDFVGKCMLSSFVFLIFIFVLSLKASALSCEVISASVLLALWRINSKDIICLIIKVSCEDFQVTMIASDQSRRDYWHWSWPGDQCVVWYWRMLTTASDSLFLVLVVDNTFEGIILFYY